MHSAGLQLLVNFNYLDERWAADPDAPGVHRLIVMVRTSKGWQGNVDRFGAADVQVRPGSIRMRLGHNTMTFEDGSYRLAVALLDRSCSAELTLEPLIEPFIANNRPLAPGEVFSWVCVPRLMCRGTVKVGGDYHVLDEAGAYHDHNWGAFAWGHDFAWEWGSALPGRHDRPWTVVYERMTDRGRTRARGQGLFLWKGNRLVRLFRDGELGVWPVGQLDCPAPLKLPRVMGILSPAGLQDIPRQLHIGSIGTADRLDVVFDADDLAQVIVPNDADVEGVTILNEVTGRIAVSGVVHGETLVMEEPGVFEFVRS